MRTGAGPPMPRPGRMSGISCRKSIARTSGCVLIRFRARRYEWADPTTASGLVEDGRSREQVEKDWKSSCDRLAKTVPKEKIFFLQISDAYKVQPEAVVEGRHRGRTATRVLESRVSTYSVPRVLTCCRLLSSGIADWFPGMVELRGI